MDNRLLFTVIVSNSTHFIEHYFNTKSETLKFLKRCYKFIDNNVITSDIIIYNPVTDTNSYFKYNKDDATLTLYKKYGYNSMFTKSNYNVKLNMNSKFFIKA